ncbi:hypothetical protein NKDENANG_00234 [Candidatus Entotheonellaceae bacterium PAL068K]
MTTLCMTTALDITQSVNPPRAAFLDYPLGYTSGEPHQPALQRAIMLEALAAFTALQTPGSIKKLPFQWSAGEAWKHTAQRGPDDDRLPRYDTPQYQNDDDRLHAEANDSACVMCPSEAVR